VEYYYDLDYTRGIFGDNKLVNAVMRVRPDLMLLSSYNMHSPKTPHFPVLRAIRSKCKIPIVALWWDMPTKGHIDASSYMFDDVDLHIFYDTGALAQHPFDKPNFLYLWPPLDFNTFHPGDGQRDIPISFLGSIGSYRSVRQEYLSYLKERNIGLYHTGGQGEELISLETYADILRRSKISLNFSFSIPGSHQLKGRLLEVLYSGALLMETENSLTKQYFTPMVDYVAFDTKEDLLDKARYYLEHEDERQEIAYNGYRKATTEYNHQVFWDRVMGKLAELKVL
jgi:hypothetical protein